MTLVFWQNIVSPHQLPFIEKISANNSTFNVILVVEKRIAEHRIQMGWETQEIQEKDNFKIVSEPNERTIKEFFNAYPNAQHFFAGIRATSMVYYAFKESLKHEIKRHLIVEGPFLYKYPFVAHYIKTLLKDYKYYKHISRVFAIGSHALNWYPKFNLKKNQIIPFSYCVDKIDSPKNIRNTGSVKLLFVGSLSHRKGVDLLLKNLVNMNRGYSLDIVGDGDQRKILESFCEFNNLRNVNFLGTKNNEEIRSLFYKYDVHILPSRHDGWGAVINEALMSGLFVICSDQCGAKELIQEKVNGIVFSHKKKNDLYNAMLYCIENIEGIREKKSKIKKWSECIEGFTIASYFIASLNSKTPLTPPWKNFKQIEC